MDSRKKQPNHSVIAYKPTVLTWAFFMRNDTCLCSLEWNLKNLVWHNRLLYAPFYRPVCVFGQTAASCTVQSQLLQTNEIIKHDLKGIL